MVSRTNVIFVIICKLCLMVGSSNVIHEYDTQNSIGKKYIVTH